MAKKKKQKRLPRRSNVSAEVFVKAWQHSKDIETVAKKTGMRVNSVRVRSRLLRKSGVKLQKFPDGRGSWARKPKNNVAKLNRLTSRKKIAAKKSTKTKK